MVESTREERKNWKRPQDYYYYIRGDHRGNKNVPVITVCILLNEDGTKYSKGFAYLSPKDNPCKEKGKQEAWSKAMKAYYRQSSFPIYLLREDDLVDGGLFMSELNETDKRIIKKHLRDK